MNIQPSLTTCERNEGNPTSDCISMKLTDLTLKIFAVALTAFSSFSLGSR